MPFQISNITLSLIYEMKNNCLEGGEDMSNLLEEMNMKNDSKIFPRSDIPRNFIDFTLLGNDLNNITKEEIENATFTQIYSITERKKARSRFRKKYEELHFKNTD